jgi:ATP-binding protein involved in chromosome partitioning
VPVSESQVIEALRPVLDPEIGKSIVELEMVRSVTVDGGSVTVLIALTVAGCPMKAEIESRVRGAVGPLPGVEQVKVDLTVMKPEELAALRAKMGGGSHAGHDHGSAGGHTFPQGRGGEAPDISFNRPGSKTRVLSITSGKGGVGKSSVTVNLAVALAKLGHDVAVLDADIYGFSVPKMLGADVQPTVLDEEEKLLLPVAAHGLRIISAGNFIPDDQAMIWRGPMLHQMLREFLTRVVWGDPDFLVVDMPPGTGDIPLSVAQYLPGAEVYVVTTPQPAAQRVAQRSALMARNDKINQPVMGVIENMSWFTGDDGTRYRLFGEGGGQLLADELGVPLLGQLPLVPDLREGGDTGLPITITDPTSEVAGLFEALAKRIESTPPPKPKQVFRPELRIT